MNHANGDQPQLVPEYLLAGMISRIPRTSAKWGVAIVSVSLPSICLLLLSPLDELKLLPKDLDEFIILTLATAFTASAWAILTASISPHRRVMLLFATWALIVAQLWWFAANATPAHMNIDVL